MKIIDITLSKSNRLHKRLKATITYGNGKKKHVHFGMKGGSTYIDNGDKTKRKNYIARHIVNEKKIWETHPTAPATLSMALLWSGYDKTTTSLEGNLKIYKNKWGIN